MSPIKNFALDYETLNVYGTFSEEDTIMGTVTFTLTKEKKVESLFIKVKGDAHVRWTEEYGETETTYSDHRRYFKEKQFLVAKKASGTVLPKGTSCFKFSLKIPPGNMPSSFTGSDGKIVYMIEAKMSRSWRWPSTVQKELKFVSKSFSHLCQLSELKGPQSGSLKKKKVQMSATVDRGVCSPGDTLSVSAKISSSSSKNMRPKFSLQQKVLYRAGFARTTSEKTLCKLVGNYLTQSEETVSCQLVIPLDVAPTINNCEIITVEYYIKVYLDISFAIDPEVKLPLVIVPSSFAALDVALGPYPAGAVGGPSYSDFPPPAFPTGPYPLPSGPNAYGYPALDPSQHANTSSGYNSQWPQQAPPCGFPSVAYPPSVVPPQVPVAPPVFKQEEPPAYMPVFPPFK